MKNSLFFLPIIWLACNSRPQQLSIVPFTILNYDTITTMNGKVFPIKGEFFLVKGYKDNAYCNNYIDSFVLKNADAAYVATGNSYKMIFYKESSRTNIKNISENRREIDRYSQFHDWIFAYHLLYNGKYNKVKIENGTQVSDKPEPKIVIKEIRD